MTDREEIVLDVNPDLAVKGVRKANESLEQFEARMKKTLGEYVKATDRGATSTERLVKNIEKQAQMYGKTGVDRLIAQRDQLIQRLGKETQAVERVNAAYAKMIAAEQKASAAKETFGGKLRSFATAPLQTATEAAEGFAEKLGPIGGLLLGIGTATVAAGVAAYKLVKNYADAAEQIQNLADRTGLTVREAEQFSEAAKMQGVDINGLVAATRRLAEAQSENSTEGARGRRALRDLKVEARDLYGNLKPTGQMIREIGEAIAKLPDTPAQLRALTSLFGRGGSENLPLFKNLPETLEYLKQIGVGMDDSVIGRLDRADKVLDKFWARWRQFWKEFAANVVSRPGPETLTSGVTNALGSTYLTLFGGQAPPSMPKRIGDPEGAIKGTQEMLTRSRWAAYKQSIGGEEGIRDRLKRVAAEMDVAEEQMDFAAHARLRAEKRSLENQLKAIQDAAKKAEEIAKQAVKVRGILDRYKAITGAAARGEAVPELVAMDKGPAEAYEQKSRYENEQYKRGIEQQIKYDEETIRQLEKTKQHLDDLDEEAAEAADKQAEKFREAYEREFDRVRDSFGGLLDSMLGGARSMWDGMRRFALALFLEPIKLQMETMFARWWMGMRGVQTGAAGGGGGFLSSLGGLFRGGGLSGVSGIVGGPGGTSGFAGPVGNLQYAGAGMMGLPMFTGGAGAGLGLTAAGIAPGLLMGSGLGMMGAYKLGGSSSPLRYGAPALGAVSGLLGYGALTALFPSLIAAGPVGWIAAAGLGATIGLIGLFRKGAEEKCREKIKAAYGVDMKDKSVLKSIVDTAKQSFGGNLDLAIRSPQIREMIELYAMMTGQKSGGAAVATMQPYSFSQTGGGLNYNPTYSNGSPVSIASAPSRVVLQLDPQATRDVLEGRAVDAIANNPREVQASANRATAQNSGRRTASIRTLRPSLVIS